MACTAATTAALSRCSQGSGASLSSCPNSVGVARAGARLPARRRKIRPSRAQSARSGALNSPRRTMLDTLETHARRAAGRLPASHPPLGGARRARTTPNNSACATTWPRRPAAAIDDGVMVTVVDGGMGYAATGDVSEAGLRRRLRTRPRAGARQRRPHGDRLRAASPVHRLRPLRQRASSARPSASLPEKLGWLQRGLRRRQRMADDPRIVDRHATLWSVHDRAALPDERRRAHRAAVGVHDAVGAGHGACQRRDPGPLQRRPVQRLLPAGRHRGAGARAASAAGRPARRARGARAGGRRALPQRHDGRDADARPDDAADPREHRPPAGARPHPRRRAQLRRHQLRHAGHVRPLPATAASCSTSASTPASRTNSPASRSTTTARRPSARC